MSTTRGSARTGRTSARLIAVHEPRDPVGAVVVVHGGEGRGGMARVSPAQLSVLRMIPVARVLARAGRGRLAVYRLLNSYRGWDSTHTPVQDLHWALDEVRTRLGAVPICVVGHSLGGRAALLAGDHPGVVGVVALAAWVQPTDPVDLTGRSVLFLHGSRDRIAPPARALALAQRLARTTEVRFAVVEGGRHAMLGRRRAFRDHTVDFVAPLLLPR